jgi:hypothetical protein
VFLILAVRVLIPCESHNQSRQDSISVEIKDANTFVRTSWIQGRSNTPSSNVGENVALSLTSAREIAVCPSTIAKQPVTLDWPD